MNTRALHTGSTLIGLDCPQPMGMRWSRLVEAAGVTGTVRRAGDPTIVSVVEDSRQVKPGACFIATRGTQADGHDFIAAAVAAGASAIVHERPVTLPEHVASVQLPSTRGLAARLAVALHGLDELQRAGKFKLIGITGTNGKSTFCYLERAILQQAGRRSALLGTIQYDLLSRTIEASMTTPPAATLMEYLAEAAQAGAQHAVMEVSSHALDQGRCEGVKFAVAVFSNLTGDHLDYHGDMDSYLRAKKRLFDGLEPDAFACVNVDDPAAERIVADCRAEVIRYGIIQPHGQTHRERQPDFYARIIESSPAGTRFEMVVTHPRLTGGHDELCCEVRSSLIGRHNVQNSLAAASAAMATGVSLEDVKAGLEVMRAVPGRLQRVEVPGRADVAGLPTVFVDYAHTDDGLTNVLSALKPLTPGRLIVLFGCGGDRDRTKRPRMAATAGHYADHVIVTSDNPRTEDPERIIEDILAGFTAAQRERVTVQPDRREAIAAAVAMGGPGDVVLLAGKGHENYQIIGRERLPFDDVAEATRALAART